MNGTVDTQAARPEGYDRPVCGANNSSGKAEQREDFGHNHSDWYSMVECKVMGDRHCSVMGAMGYRRL